MEIQILNDKVNDLAVLRSEISTLELARSKMTESIDQQIEALKTAKNDATDELVKIMGENDLKSWKTDMATISKAQRFTAKIDPVYFKNIEKQLKEGKTIENWKLDVNQYISIRNNQK